MAANQIQLDRDAGERLDQFECEWLRGSIPDVANYLRDAESAGPRYLSDLIELDLEYRWKKYGGAAPRPARDDHGFPMFPLLEDYAAVLPDGVSGQVLTPNLVGEEYRVRTRWGDRPGRQSFLDRFPGDPAAIAAALDSIDAEFALEEVVLAQDQPSDLLGDQSTVANLHNQSGRSADGAGGTAAAVPPPQPGPDRQRIGQYEILSPISTGGMGVVYRAYQRSVGRLVAVKMIRPEKIGPDLLKRFQRESTAIGRLQHPHIIQVIEAGEHQGHPFFSMELAADSLELRLKTEAFTHEEAGRLLIVLARAIQHAHDKGILHRDLKPSNILFTEDRIPKVSDFGLAKIFDVRDEACRNLTEDDAVLGTPLYMAPEQARGETRQVGPQTDIHALGAILYRLVAGRPPFVGENQLETITAVREREAEPPSRHDATVCADLDAICLRCLQKTPAQRYASAAALADDLEAWLAGQRSGALAAVRRRARRRQALAVAAVAGTVALGFSLRPSDPERSLRDHLRGVESRLRTGAETTLVGGQGLPGWHEWIGDGRLAEITVGPDGAARISSGGTVLLNLVKDPQHEAFRIDVELRHDTVGGSVSAAGLFVGQRPLPGSKDGSHACMLLRFNELFDEQAAHALFVMSQRGSSVPLPPPPEGNAARLCPYVLVNGAHGREHDFELAGATVRYLRDPDSPWRHLTIEVRAHSVKAFFDDNPNPMEVTFEQFAERVAQGVAGDDGRSGTLPIRFDPRGSLGLYVKVGSVSFRNLVIQPLGPAL